MEDLNKYLNRWIWAEQSGKVTNPKWQGLHYIDKVEDTCSVRRLLSNDEDEFIYYLDEVQLIKQLTKEEALALNTGDEVIILDTESVGFGKKLKLEEKIIIDRPNSYILYINNRYNVLFDRIGIIEDNYVSNIKPVDPHAGMIYNPISGTYSWL